MSKPSFFLTADCIAFLEEQAPALLADLRNRASLEVGDFAAAPADSPLGVAREAAKVLHKQVCSSDADVPFFPCVVRDLTDDPWAALGTTRTERVKLSGWDNARLEVREVGAVQALANLSDDSFGDVDEYVEPDDQEVLASAGRLLEKQGALMNLRLAFPEESVKLVLILANSSVPEQAGVVSLSVET